ncbi:MAG: response regulator transcription factor [Thiotrichaceae bacterium]|nr:response regulator transcription factor [Thiotrichaceae bacterium]
MDADKSKSLCSDIIFVIDDDDDMLKYLTALLRSANFDVKGFSNAATFLADYQAGFGACVISDMMMPEIDGLELQKIMAQREIHLPLIFISAFGNIPMAKNAILNGAADFLEKPLDAMELLKSVKAVLKKYPPRKHRLQGSDDVQRHLEKLTKREHEILDRLFSGETNKEIAGNLKISLRTVENHRNNILHKMNVKRYSDLLRLLLVTS